VRRVSYRRGAEIKGSKVIARPKASECEGGVNGRYYRNSEPTRALWSVRHGTECLRTI
jgi:hypothetical protein